jgi:uncharacterized membrane protein
MNYIKKYKNYSFTRRAWSVFLFSLFCVSLIIIKVVYTQKFHYIFLIWNLFLAWIPLFMTRFIVKRKRPNVYKFAVVFFSWLLFLPNAPYLITDLIHLKESPSGLIWFDGMIIFSIAITALYFGLLSTHFIHQTLLRFTSKAISWCIILASFLFSGFGVYLGRFGRWNSWDIFTQPFSLLSDCLNCLSDFQAIVMTISFSTFLTFSYLVFTYNQQYEKKYH